MSTDSSKLHSIFTSTRNALLKHTTSRKRDPALAVRTPTAHDDTKRPLPAKSYSQDLAQVTHTAGSVLRVNRLSDASEDESARAVREYFF
jgi:hypothetical protein